MLEVSLDVAAPGWGAEERWAMQLHGIAAAALAGAGKGRLVADPALSVEISVLLADDAAVAQLNREWREREGPTNILSFPMLAPAELESDLGRTMVPIFLGDLALAHGTIVREAEAAGLALEAHVAHLMVHGVLHLLGHDHVADSEAEEMEALERVILAGLGIADPYARHGRGKAPAVAEA